MKSKFNKLINGIKNILGIIVKCIAPVLPILIGVGLIKVILILLGPIVFNILSEESNTYIVLSFVADAGYYFMPIYIAMSAAEVFNTDKYLGALCGAMLISPVFIQYVANGETLTIFGLPIAMTNYANQLIPSIIIAWILSIVYKFLDKHTNVNLKPIVVPLLSIIIMIPISFCIIGPLGYFLGNGLVSMIMLLTKLGPLGSAIMCASIPYITILGLSGANLSAMLVLATTGCDPILFFSNVVYNTALGFVALAIYLKEKKPETLAASITSTVAGISEPALFGTVIKHPTALLSLTTGNFLAGLYFGITKVKAYAMSSFGIFGIMATIGPDSSIIHATIAILISCIVSFILSYLTYKKAK